jgi:two-component system, OmpR family, KDP operon response regulator KdpE
MVQRHILVVEDDAAISQFLTSSLSAAGFSASICKTLKKAAESFTSKKPQLVILDLELPDGDGKDFIKQLRVSSDIPVIVLSARQCEQEKVLCFEIGADDYLPKPFGIRELLARVQLAMRRAGKMTLRDDVYSLDGLEIDSANGLISLHQEVLHLTPIEHKLLIALAKAPGRIFTHQHLLASVWGDAYINDTHYLRIHMGRLRAKIERNPASPRFIITELGIGYRLAAN